ncbi:MAG: chitobiase/beta-hexosaminidase C-terminal domain-containing protein [Candidatus Cloacimonetes bacterium]|nr:chitobiase/beta-hexosaminidase C-terminal domain-containing protein [Candidatus Cloacimonadota bacterium]
MRKLCFCLFIILLMQSCSEMPSRDNPYDLVFDLGAVTDLTAFVLDENTIQLDWQYSGEAINFHIDRKENNNDWQIKYAVLPATQLNFADDSVTSGNNYTYIITAVADQNQSTAAETSINFTLMVTTPIIYPPGGTYFSEQEITITCGTSGAIIRYTTDGSTPTISSTIYSSPISVNFPMTINAKAFKTGWLESSVTSAIYTFPAATPVYDPQGGYYNTDQEVTISCATSNATIRYTTNGSDPTSSSTQYTTPLSISSTTTLKAKAFKSNYSPSSTATATYTITLPTVATPTFNPIAGTYNSPQPVSITCATSGATIRYTTNGYDPTSSSTQYTTPLSISSTTTLKAKAFKANYNSSSTAAATYTITLPTVATPTFNPVAGTYNSPQTVSITCATSSATIRYTTNGSDPTSSSTQYTTPLSISSTTTLKAKAFKSNYSPSSTATAVYTIMPSPLTIIYPNGGEVINRGQEYTITWDPGPNTNTVDVLLYKGTQLWTAIQNYTVNDGSITWTVSFALQTGDDYRIKICNSDMIIYPDDYDFSDGYFSIE